MQSLDNELKQALSDQLLAWGDDELILGHRASEWCGHAPILEEDIAFANLALDEIGHATTWYTLLADLEGQDSEIYPDRLVFAREAGLFRNVQMVELPNGDWAFSMLRQYLFDESEQLRLEGLRHSRYSPIAEAADKIRKEEIYHIRHTRAWVPRLSLGTDESHTRMQQALNQLWPYTLQLFTPLPEEERLAAAGFVPPGEQLFSAWQDRVLALLQECELELPEVPEVAFGREQHTSHLRVLVEEMQAVARLDPQAEW